MRKGQEKGGVGSGRREEAGELLLEILAAHANRGNPARVGQTLHLGIGVVLRQHDAGEPTLLREVLCCRHGKRAIRE